MPSPKSDGYCPPLRDPHQDKVAYLAVNGYFDGDFPDAGKLSEKDLLFKKATLSFQHLADLNPTGNFDEQSVRRTYDKCCALPDLDKGFVQKNGKWVEWSIASACSRKWATKNLTCAHNMKIPTMSDKDVTTAWLQAKQNWMKNCGIKFTQVPYTGSRCANFVHSMEAMDGRSGKLAYHFLPNCGESADSTLFGRFDTGENWSFKFFLAVVGHEDGHGLGLSHDTSRDSLLYPYYQSGITEPTGRDRARVVNLYGEPTGSIPPGPTPTPTPGNPTLTLEQRVLQNELSIAVLFELMKAR